MRNIPKILSFLGLACVIVPPVLYFLTWIEKPAMSSIMLLGTVFWFATSPLWIGRKA